MRNTTRARIKWKSMMMCWTLLYMCLCCVYTAFKSKSILMGEQSKQRIFRTNLSNAHTQHHPHPHKINRNAIKRQVATHWNEKKIDNIGEKKLRAVEAVSHKHKISQRKRLTNTPNIYIPKTRTNISIDDESVFHAYKNRLACESVYVLCEVVKTVRTNTRKSFISRTHNGLKSCLLFLNHLGSAILLCTPISFESSPHKS